MDSWNAFMIIGNGWQSTITNVQLQHSVKDGNGGTKVTNITVPTLEMGAVSSVALVTTYKDQDDNWSLAFTDDKGVQHSATITSNIETEDENGIVFHQVTKENGRWSLYFPVSSDDWANI